MSKTSSHARTVPLAAALLCLASAGATAQDLVTDRPDVTESAESVDAGRVQLEVGATWAEAGSEDVLAGPEALVRVGLERGWELRLAPGAWVDGPGATSGRDDGSVGVKLELGGSPGGGAAAVIVDSTVPTGDDEVGVDAWQPGALVSLAWDLPGLAGRATSLGINLGVRSAVDDGPGGERFEQATWSAALGTTLGGSSWGSWGAFGELFGTSRDSPDGDPVTGADVGVTLLLSPDLQLDTALGTLLDGGTGEDDEWFVTVGLSYRW